jgi:hypothetical protein
MKIIAFINAHQPGVIRRILEHCGLWEHPPSRGPPNPTPGLHPGEQPHDDDPDSRLTHQLDPDFLEFARREQFEEPEPTWEN